MRFIENVTKSRNMRESKEDLEWIINNNNNVL